MCEINGKYVISLYNLNWKENIFLEMQNHVKLNNMLIDFFLASTFICVKTNLFLNSNIKFKILMRS